MFCKPRMDREQKEVGGREAAGKRQLKAFKSHRETFHKETAPLSLLPPSSGEAFIS